MILNIRGTSGAGKTWLARRLMDAAGGSDPVVGVHPNKPGRELIYGHAAKKANIFFVGSYEATCGGCDKFSWKGAADWIQELIANQALVPGRHVVFEGLIVGQWKAQRFKDLATITPLDVILLSTAIGDCLGSVTDRRTARGVVTALNPTTTVYKHKYNLRKSGMDRAAGLSVHHLDREAAYAFACEKLGL